MIKVEKIKGIPEWLPEYKKLEISWLQSITKIYEGFGYLPIETGAFERLDTLQLKGEIDKEIYLINNKNSGDESKFGMHYDLTVPFSRYVIQNYNALTFPFKRYQAQKVWRGERPQRGRFREFYQCDIDVIDNEKLNAFYDIEVLYAGEKALASLNLPRYEIGISNRKIYEGYLESIGIINTTDVLRVIDKLDKYGETKVLDVLKNDLNVPDDLLEKALLPSKIKTLDLSFVEKVKSLGVQSQKMDSGIEELKYVYENLLDLGCKNIVVDLSFVRGFDYYTGIIFEGKFIDDINYGSICSGGRYENLAGKFSNKKLPGVGFSIGLTRIFAKLIDEKLISLPNKAMIDAIIFRTRENDLTQVFNLSEILRKKGLTVEIFNSPVGINKQFTYAAKKNIRWVWIESINEKGMFEVRDRDLNQQKLVDNPTEWNPD